MEIKKLFTVPRYKVFLANGKVVEKNTIAAVFEDLYSKQTYGFEVENFDFFNNGENKKSYVRRYIIGKVISKKEATEIMINQPNVGFINFSPLYTSAEFFYNEDFNLLITKTSGMFALKLSDDCKANESYSFAVEPKFSFLTREGGKIAANNFITLHPGMMSKYMGFMAESIEYSQCLHEGKPIAKYKGARRFIWGTILSEKEKDAYLQKNSDFIELKALPDSKVRWYAVNESHKVIVPLEQNCFAIPFKEWRAIK